MVRIPVMVSVVDGENKLLKKYYDADGTFKAEGDLFTDEDGFPNYEDFDEEVDKLFEIFEYIIVTDDDYIYGFRNGKKELISDFATEGYSIALEVTDN